MCAKSGRLMISCGQKLQSLQHFCKLQTCCCTYVVPCLLTYLLHGAVLLEKLPGFQLVKKFPALYGTRRFITAFTSARHLSLSWASLIQSIPLHPTSWRSILILSSLLLLSLPSGLVPSGLIVVTNHYIHCVLPTSIVKVIVLYCNTFSPYTQVWTNNTTNTVHIRESKIRLLFNLSIVGHSGKWQWRPEHFSKGKY